MDVQAKSSQHWWTLPQRAKLLKLIIEKTNQVHRLDRQQPPIVDADVVLRGEAWSWIRDQMNKSFGINISIAQIHNQRASIRKTFLDYHYLRCQAGFTWDSQYSTLIADQNTWDQFKAIRSRHNLAMLKDRPFPIYDLANQVFNRTKLGATSGHQTADSKILISPSAQGLKTEEDGTAVKEEEINPKKRVCSLILNDDDSDIEVLENVQESDSATPPSKRHRKAESLAERNGTNNLINPLGAAPAEGPASLTSGIASTQPQEQDPPSGPTTTLQNPPSHLTTTLQEPLTKSLQEKELNDVVKKGVDELIELTSGITSTQPQEQDPPSGPTTTLQDPPSGLTTTRQDPPPRLTTTLQEPSTKSLQDKELNDVVDQGVDELIEGNDTGGSSASEQDLPTKRHPEGELSASKKNTPADKEDQPAHSLPPLQASSATNSQAGEPSNEIMTGFEKLDDPTSEKDGAEKYNFKSVATALREEGQVDPLEPLLQASISARAIKSLADLFMNQVDDRDYARFVRVLENQERAATFIVLVHTSNKSICQQWLNDCVR